MYILSVEKKDTAQQFMKILAVTHNRVCMTEDIDLSIEKILDMLIKTQ